MSRLSARVALAAAALWVCAVSGLPEAAVPGWDRHTVTPAESLARPAILAAQASPAPRVTAIDHAGTVQQYCGACHSSRAASTATAGGVVLDAPDLAGVPDQAAMWEQVVRRLRTGSMPPAGMPRPDAATTAALVTHLERSLDAAAAKQPNPGRHAIHRLNRSEYANAIRDLLSLEVDTSTLLPPDDSADGFDNNADLLGVSPALLERYLSAAARISELAVGSNRIVPGSETYRIRGDASQVEQNEELSPGTRGGLLATHTFPLDGEYVIKARLLETNLGSIRGLEYEHQFEFTLDGERVLLAPVGGANDYVESSVNATNVVNSLDKRLQVRVKVKAGQRAVGAAFLRRPPVYGGSRLQPFLRTTLMAGDHLGLPHVESMTVTGPFNAADVVTVTETPSRQRVFICRPARAADETACAATVVRTLARRAYRREVTDADLAGLMAFYEQGRREAGFERGIELALRGVLVSPKFVFRAERTPAQPPSGQAYRISDTELASRLSFFLWSSIPDDELLDAAASGRLRQPAVLERQVRRMLADARAQALVGNFAAQWLHFRNLRSTTPDKNLYPDFDDNLRQGFERELELFVGSIMQEDRNVLDLMTADHTFVNERLARHYGIPHVYGSRFRRVTVEQDARKGLLGKGGILLVTSHADRTSPVVRGKWILENLIGTPPPPAPAEVPAFPEDDPKAPQTVRARMERHRASPACASCHKVMDPLGLALENFDAVGKWREQEAGVKIDASGLLADGTQVDGVVAMRKALLARPEVLAGTFTEKLLTYALGRGLEHYDMPAVRDIVRTAGRDDYRFSSLVLAIVRSVPFQMRTGGEQMQAGGEQTRGAL
jgi:mono/diheme cytochrome c family protein